MEAEHDERWTPYVCPTELIFGGAERTIACSCERHCGDVSEESCHPLAVCKGLPDAPRRPLVEVVLVPRRSDAR